MFVSNDPDNLDIKIIDFGFAAPVSESDEGLDLILGSPLYMAPEIVTG